MGADFHTRPNGDRWRLMCEDNDGPAFVRHLANEPSGGHVTDTSVEEFLAEGAAGPEHAALRRVVGELIREQPNENIASTDNSAAG